MRTLLTIVGVVMFLLGLLWAAQGEGFITWPASSFMIGQERWSNIGMITAIAGAAIILLSRWVGRPRV